MGEMIFEYVKRTVSSVNQCLAFPDPQLLNANRSFKRCKRVALGSDTAKLAVLSKLDTSLLGKTQIVSVNQ